MGLLQLKSAKACELKEQPGYEKIDNWDITDSDLTSKSRKSTRGQVYIYYKQPARVTTNKQKIKVKTREKEGRSGQRTIKQQQSSNITSTTQDLRFSERKRF